MIWYWLAWKQCLIFEGRTSRKAFWMFFLINFCIGSIFIWAEIYLKLHWAFDVIYTCASLLPTLSITIRRLHDIDRSGWWTLLIFVPGLGVLILLFLLAQKSKGSSDHNDFLVNKELVK